MSDNNTQNLENLNKLFNAIDTIVQKRIENLPYDKTIIATIEDASKASEGQYVVNDGTITFLAYSENTTYTQGQQVYINIPQGDYNKQRIIVGKYFPNDDKKFIYNYVSPMNTFANVSGNIISSDQNQWALIANGTQKSITLYEDYVSFSGYDTLGVSAEFRTWLNNYKDISSGTYGLQIDVASGDDIEEHSEDALFYTFYFTNKDMFGDPYNYDTFFSQEKVFDISGLKKIDAIRVKFFQDQDFIFSTNNTYMNPGDENDESSYNLFVRNPVVAIGYDLSKFSDDTVLIYTSDGKTFFSSATDDLKAKYENIDFTKEEEALPIFNKVNQKNLGVRWIHFFKEEEKSGVYNISSSGISSARAITIDDETDFDEPFNIKWFRYNKQENSSNIQYDKNVGEYWDEITEEKNNYFITVNPDIKKENEQYLAMIEYPSLESVEESIEEELSKTLYIQKSELLNKDILIGENQNYLNLFFSEITIDTVQNIQDSILAIEKDYKEKLQLYTSNSTLTEEERLSLIEEINSINRNHEQALNYLNALITALNNNSPTGNLNFSLYITPYKIYNYFLELLNDNIIDYLKHLDKIISDLKKIIEDSSELQTQVQSTLDSSKYSIIVKELKNLFPKYFSQDYIIAFLNMGYDVNNPDAYKTSIKTFLETFREEFPNINEYSFGNDNQNEKEALLSIKENIDQINKVDNDIQEYKSVELGKINHYLSKPIVFENNDPNAALNAVKDNLSELQILVDEGGLQGIYNVYREDGYIQNDSYVNELRTLKVQYPDGSNPIGENETITWKFPLINTMIQEPEEGIEYNLFTEVSEGEVTADNFKNGNYYYWDEEDNKYIQITATSQIPDNNGDLHNIEFNNIETYYIKNNNINAYKENGYFIIKRTGKDNTEQSFRIKSFLSPANTNNEIYCSIAKEINDLSASASLSFPSSGIQGTNYSFYLEFYNNKNNFALQAKGSAEETRMNVRARLFNEAHKEITSEHSFTWGLVNSSDGIEVSSSNSSSCQIYSKIPGEDWDPTKFAHGILKCTCEVNIDFDHQYQYMKYNNQNHSAELKSQEKSKIQLTAYLLIPVIKDENSVGGYAGNGYICYDNGGVNPQYYNSPFKVYNTSLEDANGIWEIYGIDYSEITLTQNTYKPNKYYILQNGQYILSTDIFDAEQTYFNSEERFYPKITTDGSLMVPSIYMADEKPLSLQYKINNIVEFILPLRIYKYVYGNKFINSWDGSLTLNENDGIILSTMMGAGYKDSSNNFNGILMGDMSETITKKDDESEEDFANRIRDKLYYTGTGLYGYNEGQKSFGFNINGYGFIGRVGAGQIKFDGNSGIIESANYVAGEEGTYLNLANGFFETAVAVLREGCWIGGTRYNEGAWKITGHTILNSYEQPNEDDPNILETMYMGIGTLGHSYAFFAGAKRQNGDDGIFRVGHNGVLWATNANLTGKIETVTLTNWGAEYVIQYQREIRTIDKKFQKLSSSQQKAEWDAMDTYMSNTPNPVVYKDLEAEHKSNIKLEEDSILINSQYISRNSNINIRNAINSLNSTFTIEPVFSQYDSYSNWSNLTSKGATQGRQKTSKTIQQLVFSSSGSESFKFNDPVYINGDFCVIAGWDIGRVTYRNISLQGNVDIYNNLNVSNQLYVGDKTTLDWDVFMPMLDEDSGGSSLYIKNNGKVVIHVSGGSSKNYKTDIKILENKDIQKLYNIPIYTFKYKEGHLNKNDEKNDKTLPGFITEDLEQIVPEAIQKTVLRDKSIRYMWDYEVIIPLMFQMIKNNHEEIQQLQKENQKLKEKIYENK